MLKIACSFTGDNYNMLAVDTPASKKKVVAMALAMSVPVFIWIFNGFMLSFQVLNASFGSSFITAIACGIIVFLIEKLIIMANGNGWLTFLRVCIGLIVAVLGSMAIDEVVFKDDIDISVGSLKTRYVSEERKKAEDEFIRSNDYTKLNGYINSQQSLYDKAQENAINEADGTNGTGKPGVGTITKFKDQKAKERKAELDQAINRKNFLDKRKDSTCSQAAIIAFANFKEHALLTRVKALFQLVSEDGYMLCIYILFSLLMFFFEFIVVILKLTWKKTNYERKVEMIEEIGERRIKLLQSPNHFAYDPGMYLNDFQNTRDLVSKRAGIYN